MFTSDLDLPRGRERRPVHERDRVYEIDAPNCSHIRIDAKRQALDALGERRRRAESNGNGKPANDSEIETIVEVADDLTSQSRHGLLLSGSRRPVNY